MLLRKLWIVVVLLCAFGAKAELVATPLPGDARLVEFTYDVDNTFLILAKPKALTHIQFAPDEVPLTVAAGDTAQWQLTVPKTKHSLLVKPKYEGIETSLTVITDKRTYQIILRSTGDKRKWYQRVSWLYPEEVTLDTDAQLNHGVSSRSAAMVRQGSSEPPMPLPPALNGVPGPSRPMVTPSAGTPQFVEPGMRAGLSPDVLGFSYEIVGEAEFKPIIVFDDRRFTYFKMPPNLQELPVMFAVIDGEDYSLVNYTVKGDYMVAQRLMDEAVLKLGKSEVRVKRKGGKPKAPTLNSSYVN